MAKPVVQPLSITQHFSGAVFSFEGAEAGFSCQAHDVVELERVLALAMAFEAVRRLLGVEVVSSKRRRGGGSR